MRHFLSTTIIYFFILTFVSFTVSCSQPSWEKGEIIIAINEAGITLLLSADNMDPMHTGIQSLDALNEKWHVSEMVRVFQGISETDDVASKYGLMGIYKLLVPVNTDLKRMIEEYEADPHIEYAELNQTVEMK